MSDDSRQLLTARRLAEHMLLGKEENSLGASSLFLVCCALDTGGSCMRHGAKLTITSAGHRCSGVRRWAATSIRTDRPMHFWSKHVEIRFQDGSYGSHKRPSLVDARTEIQGSVCEGRVWGSLLRKPPWMGGPPRPNLNSLHGSIWLPSNSSVGCDHRRPNLGSLHDSLSGSWVGLEALIRAGWPQRRGLVSSCIVGWLSTGPPLLFKRRPGPLNWCPIRSLPSIF